MSNWGYDMLRRTPRQPHPRNWGEDWCTGDELEQAFADSDVLKMDEDGTCLSEITDVDYSLSWRKIFYPSGFRKQTRINIYNRDKGKNCYICNQPLRNGQNLSIDHKQPVAVHFNSAGFGMNQSARADWYNNEENLALVHAKCNSEKGSENVNFDIAKVGRARF